MGQGTKFAFTCFLHIIAVYVFYIFVIFYGMYSQYPWLGYGKLNYKLVLTGKLLFY
jgi:hypothetical protein